jgi:hypothetical protein
LLLDAIVASKVIASPKVEHMHKDFTICPHCSAKGKERVIRPATPHRTPLITRSDGISFHLFVEESYIRRASSKLEVVALFRYDLDPTGVTAESALAQIRVSGNDTTEVLEQAADTFAEVLARGVPLERVYAPTEFDTGGGKTAA